MKNERQWLYIKGWLYRSISNVSNSYYCLINVYNRNDDGTIPSDEVKVLVDEVYDETEKAVEVRLSTGIIDGSAKGWRCWIPKSAIVA